MGTCGQPGYVFRDFYLKQGIDVIIFCSYQGIDFIIFCLKQGIFSWTINSLRDSVDQAVNSFVIANGFNKKEFRYLLLPYTEYVFGLNVKNRNSVLNRVGKSAIFVLNSVSVWGAGPHLPPQGYIVYPPPPRGAVAYFRNSRLRYQKGYIVFSPLVKARASGNRLLRRAPNKR